MVCTLAQCSGGLQFLLLHLLFLNCRRERRSAPATNVRTVSLGCGRCIWLFVLAIRFPCSFGVLLEYRIQWAGKLSFSGCRTRLLWYVVLCVGPPCCVSIISVSGDFCWHVVTGELGSFSISNSYVFCRLRSPCNCDSDWRLDCFWSPVAVALDGVHCVGGASTVSVAVLPIVVELSGLVAELPVSVASMLSWRTLYIIFKSLPSRFYHLVGHPCTYVLCIMLGEGEWLLDVNEGLKRELFKGRRSLSR